MTRCIACRTAKIEADTLRDWARRNEPSAWQLEDREPAPRARPVWIRDGEAIVGKWILVTDLPEMVRGRFRLLAKMAAQHQAVVNSDLADLADPLGGRSV